MRSSRRLTLGIGPAISIWPWPTCALLTLPEAAQTAVQDLGKGLQSWLGVDKVRLLAGGEQRG